MGCVIPALIGLALLATSVLIAILADTPFPAAMPAVLGVLVLGGTVFERRRYRRLDRTAPGFGWRDTGERFVDIETKAPVAVFFNAATGERRYVRQEALTPPAPPAASRA